MKKLKVAVSLLGVAMSGCYPKPIPDIKTDIIPWCYTKPTSEIKQTIPYGNLITLSKTDIPGGTLSVYARGKDTIYVMVSNSVDPVSMQLKN